ncbi:trophoblast glycoprotein [Anthonomus grandis grandis]|uniref:trophoblast glycoprotein n=1 Tax=Anthonomus grandis grandis TaxID=2921223 RepID=UPI00216607AD|nr:trophoblast glycoprotein [Anthonomus grandis grandis]XP_050306118.1 trophoblast glycoprotein [Anthonomus grandis grandis]
MKTFSQVFFLASFFAPLWSKYNECGNELEKCICGKQYMERETKFVVNCTNTHFTNTDVLLALPENTNYLIFTGNYLNVLPVNIFGEDADLSELEVIDMSNNAIREIKGKTFHHVNKVRRLILNHNNISIAEEYDKNFHHPRVFSNFENLQELHLTNAFADNTDAELADDLHDIFVNSNLTKLYKLHLEQNEIKNWRDDRVFCDLPNLHDLYLGDNNIPSLNFNILCLKKLRFLDLEHNNITKFSERDLDTFDQLANDKSRTDTFTLEIGSNPLKCDSASTNLYNWLQKTNVRVRNKDVLQCVGAKFGNPYKVNLKKLAESKHAKISKALAVLLIVLTCVLISLAAAYVYLKKDNFKTKLSPMFEAITRKVHYTTIESQDV